MTLVGCDLHSRKQQVAVLDTITGELLEQELVHEGDAVERFYRALRPPVTIGIETTGYTQWFHTLMHGSVITSSSARRRRSERWSSVRRRPIGAMRGTSSTSSGTIGSRPSGSLILPRGTFAPSLLTGFGSSG
jgi:hypothetical protein